MRNRSRSDENNGQRSDQRETSRDARRDASVRDKDRDDDGDNGRRVRIPKIQYRFLKELEERGVSESARGGALDMAEKIRRYPLDERAVMGSWERFTKKAIEEFKKGGHSQERDRQHLSYAILFSTLRDKPPAQNGDELKKRIESYQTPASRKQAGVASPDDAPQRARSRPEQRELLQQEPAKRELPRIDEQIETTLDRLRELPSPLRASIEASARDMVVEGHHTWRSARQALPDAIKDLRADRSEKNTVHTFTLALIAKSASHGELRAELDSMKEADHKPIAEEARARLERYPPLETGINDVRRDAAAAGIKYAMTPNAATRREALVLAEAREQIETLADPKRLQWDGVGEDLAERLA